MRKLFLFLILFSFLGGSTNSLKAQGIGWMTFDPATFGQSLLSAVRDFKELTAYYDQIKRLGGKAQDVISSVKGHIGNVRNLQSNLKDWKNNYLSKEGLSIFTNGAPRPYGVADSPFDFLNGFLSTSKISNILMSGKSLDVSIIPGLASSLFSDLKSNVSELNLFRSRVTTEELDRRADDAEELYLDSASERAPEVAVATTNALLVEGLKNDASIQQNANLDRSLAAAKESSKDSEKAMVGSFYKSRLDRFTR